jgi:membrane protein YqaA with SNARE-associated domain
MRRWILVWIILIIIGVIIYGSIFLFAKEYLNDNPELMEEVIGYQEEYEDEIDNYGLIGIFLLTIVGGTVLALGTPGIVAGGVVAGIPTIPLILIASAGFTLGCSVSYVLAWVFGDAFVKKRYSEQYDDILGWWDRWGFPFFVIFAFIPLLPVDLFALACGLFKMHPHYFLGISFAGRLVCFAMWAFIGGIAAQSIGLSLV